MSKGKRLAIAKATAEKEVDRLRKNLRCSNSIAARLEISTRLFDAEQAMAKAKCLRLLARAESDKHSAKRHTEKAALITAKFEAKYEVPLWD